LLLVLEDENRSFSAFCTDSSNRINLEFISYYKALCANVIDPLKELSKLVDGPTKLISKRYDKLIDYEAALADYEFKSDNGAKSVSKEVSQAFTCGLEYF
jgi:hypothetical protein